MFIHSARTIWFPLLHIYFLKSDKAAIGKEKRGKGKEFQMTKPTYLIKFFPKYLVLTFGKQNSDFKRNCAELLFIAKMFFRRHTMFNFKHFYR